MKKHPINPSVLAIALSHAILHDVVQHRMAQEDAARPPLLGGIVDAPPPVGVEALVNTPVVDAGDLDQG